MALLPIIGLLPFFYKIFKSKTKLSTYYFFFGSLLGLIPTLLTIFQNSKTYNNIALDSLFNHLFEEEIFAERAPRFVLINN